MKSMSPSSRTACLFVVAACAAIARSSDAFQVVMMTPLRSPSSGLSMSRSDGVEASRRMAIESVFGLAASAAVLVATSSSPQVALALDMDAFVNSQLDSDTKNCDPKKDPKCLPKLTEDAALCKYGQSGEARAAACKRYKASGGALPAAGAQGKSLGGAYAM